MARSWVRGGLARICTWRFVEVEAAHEAEVGAEDSGEEVDEFGLAPEGLGWGVDFEDVSGGDDDVAAGDGGLVGLVGAEGMVEVGRDGGDFGGGERCWGA